MGEQDFVAQLGLRYFNIPVSGAIDLTEDKARALGEVINNRDNHPVLMHCMSGNRVGALVAMKTFLSMVPARNRRSTQVALPA